MSSEERMTIDERLKYLRGMRKRYEQASRVEQGRLLDEMEAVTGLHRKSLTRLLNGPLVRKRRQQQRGSTYGAAVDDALRVIAESVDYVCAERLTPNLVWLANHLAAHSELVATPELVDALGQISVSTVRRRLARLQQDQPRLPRQGPERANQVTRAIPMRRIPWDEAQPGHFEIDTVHHCGISASGDYVHSLQWIDGATGWSERVAVLGRSFRVMEDACRYILARLPFPVLELHPDNGSEFLNHHLLRFFRQQVSDAHLSRSRPYHKNDNRKVEQKNSTLVRALIGSTPSSKLACSINSTIRCGSTTTSSSRSCTWSRSRPSPSQANSHASSAASTRLRPPLIVCAPRMRSPTRIGNACRHSVITPTLANSVRQSIPCVINSLPCRRQCQVQLRMSSRPC